MYSIKAQVICVHVEVPEIKQMNAVNKGDFLNKTCSIVLRLHKALFV